MSKIYLLIFLILNISCNESQQKSVDSRVDSSVNTKDSIIRIVGELNSEVGNQNFFNKIDTLSNEEKSFLAKLSNENEFIIIPNKIERYYSRKDSSALFATVIFSKEFLLEKGYVFFELKFYGKISDVRLFYSYSLGQASIGYGSVVGDDAENYLHTFKSCGVTTCVTQVYQSGQKLFEKDN